MGYGARDGLLVGNNSSVGAILSVGDDDKDGAVVGCTVG